MEKDMVVRLGATGSRHSVSKLARNRLAADA